MSRKLHGAHRLLSEVGPDMLVMVDAGIISGGFLEHVRQRGAHGLAALEAGAWEHLKQSTPPRRWLDAGQGWVAPHSAKARRSIRSSRRCGCAIISYRITDERLGEKDKVYRLVTTLLKSRAWLQPSRLIALVS